MGFLLAHIDQCNWEVGFTYMLYRPYILGIMDKSLGSIVTLINVQITGAPFTNLYDAGQCFSPLSFSFICKMGLLLVFTLYNCCED